MWQLYPIVYGLDKENTKDIGSVRCWLDKETNAYGLEKVKRRFKSAKFVFILRDPRGRRLRWRKELSRGLREPLIQKFQMKA